MSLKAKREPAYPSGRSAMRALLQIPQVRRIGGVALGTAAGHTALLLASPALTRIYSPEDFGAYAYFFAALGFLAPVAALRYELAVPIAATREEAWNVALTALSAAVASSLLLLVFAMGLVRADVGFMAGLGNLGWLVWGLPFGVLLSGSHQTLTYWAVRHERFRSVAYSRGGTGVGTGVVQIASGLLRAGPSGLVIGDLAGRTAASLILVRSALRTIPHIREVSAGAVLRTAARYRGFALLSSPSAVLNAAALFLPIVLVGRLHGATAAGWMFMAQRFIALPTTFLTTATSQVYVAEFATVERDARVLLYRRTVGRLTLFGGPAFLLGGIVAPGLFPLVFGAEWAPAGLLAMALAPFFFLQLLSGATVSTLDVLQLHGARLAREVAFLSITVGVFAAGYLLDMGLFSLIVTYGLCGAAFYAASLVWVHERLVRHNR